MICYSDEEPRFLSNIQCIWLLPVSSTRNAVSLTTGASPTLSTSVPRAWYKKDFSKHFLNGDWLVGRVYMSSLILPRVVAWLATREAPGAFNPMVEGERAPDPPRRMPDSQCRGCSTMKTSLSEFHKVSIMITPCSACRLTQKPSDYHLV